MSDLNLDLCYMTWEIDETIETLWMVLDRLYLEQNGMPFASLAESSNGVRRRPL
jgi:hypothetical protein